MDKILNFIKPELLILLPVLYIIGIGLKKSSVKDKFIPAILGGISIILTILHVISTSEILIWQEVITAIFTGITQGILLAGASVYAHQILKQHTKEE